MRDMRELVKGLAAQGITILLSSHILAEVEELCNRVAIVRKGRIVYEGALAELLRGAGGGFRLQVDEPERARTLLLNQPGLAGVTLADGELRFQAEPDAVAAASIALGHAGIGIRALVPHTATLEELFLGLTEAGAGEEAA
jgi:ABC-2 type transport system ATP-binding protein